jgi:hypothetical protein
MLCRHTWTVLLLLPRHIRAAAAVAAVAAVAAGLLILRIHIIMGISMGPLNRITHINTTRGIGIMCG